MASGDYTVTITLHYYSNQQETCSLCTIPLFGFYGCCNDYARRDPQCTGSNRCDTAFSFCLLPEGSFSFRPPSGPSTDTATQFDELINFPLGAVLGITNSFVLNGISNMWNVCEQIE